MAARTLSGHTDTGAKFELERVTRRRPTLGAPPPAGALVLFDGTNTDEWQPGALAATPTPARSSSWNASRGAGRPSALRLQRAPLCCSTARTPMNGSPAP